MHRLGRLLALAASLAAAPLAAHAQSAQQSLVDRATLAAEDLMNDHDGTDAQRQLRRARAVMICPQVLRAGFLFGGQGGDCVLAARDGAGSWSNPAFYTLGSGSFGFQAGLQDSEIAMMIMTDRGLRAVLDDQFKLGADAGAVFVQWGGGVEGDTTASVGADIIGFTRSRGLYAGISLSGSVMASKSGWNRLYYGKEAAAQQIVISMDANNPGAEPLRQVLGKYGASLNAAAPPAQAYPVASAQPPAQTYAPAARGTIQRQALPPPPSRPGY